jgi:Lar family restriction alleviation protein
MTTPATNTPASPAQEGTLLPCPFCGGRASMSWSHDGQYPFVVCDDGVNCEVEGPTRDTEADAAAAWNTRTPAAIAPPKEATPPALTDWQREALDCGATALQEVGSQLIYRDGRTYSWIRCNVMGEVLRALANKAQP